MKYWLFQNNQVAGPYDREQIAQVGGFSAESLVCPEGRKGTDMGDWQRAGLVPELADALMATSRVATAIRSGASSLLPPEPTLRDLAALGSLQEKTSLLENAFNALQEDMRERDTELSRLKVQMAAKERDLLQLQGKITDLEVQITALSSVKDALSKDERQLQELQDKFLQTKDELQRDITKTADEEHAAAAKLSEKEKVLDEVVGKLAEKEKVLEQLVQRIQEQERLIQELKSGAGEKPSARMPAVGEAAVAPPEPSLESFGRSTEPMPKPAEPMPAPVAKIPEPAPSLPPAAFLSPVPGPMERTMPPIEEVSTVPKFSEAPAPVVSEPSRVTSDVSLPPLQPAEIFEVPGPEEHKKKNSMKWFGAAGALALIVAGWYVLKIHGMRRGKTVAASNPEAAAPQPVPMPAMPVQPPPIVPAPPQLDPTQVAVEMAQSYMIPGANVTLAQRLESAFPADPNSNLRPWMVEPLENGDFQVDYYTNRNNLVYEFRVRPGAKTVEGMNPPAASVLRGDIPALPSPPRPKAKKVVRHRRARKARVPIAPVPAAEHPAAEAPAAPMIEPSAGVSPGGPIQPPQGAAPANPASANPAPAQPAVGSEENKNLDELLLPGVPKPVHAKH